MTTAMTKRQNGSPSATFGNVVDNIFQNSLRRFFDDNFWEPTSTLATGTVPVNVRETEQHYEMDIIAPGCKKEAFNIQVNDNVLTVSMNQSEKSETETSKKGWARNEYLLKSFSRSFTLDDTVDVANIKANYNDGVLQLLLPKNEKAKSVTRNIEVK